MRRYRRVMTNHEIHLGLLQLGYLVPEIVLTSYRQDLLRSIERWINYRQKNEITPVGRPIKFPQPLKLWDVRIKRRIRL